MSKNFAFICVYSEVMRGQFYIVKLESFTIEGLPTRAKKGCQPKLLFERFGAISNIVRRRAPTLNTGQMALSKLKSNKHIL